MKKKFLMTEKAVVSKFVKFFTAAVC